MPRIVASIRHLRKVYGMPGSGVQVDALRGVDLDFTEGESMAICGASGSGKSTMLNIMGCLDRPTSGMYRLGDLDVAHMDDDRLSAIRGRSIGFVFQSFNLIPQLTVLENVEVPLFYQGVPADVRLHRAAERLERVGLADRMHHRPMELSGGQQQRAAIARALVTDPLLLLADEPTGNLDTATGERILALLDELHAAGRTIVIVTHEDEVADRCDRVVVLRDGLIVENRRNPTRKPAPDRKEATPAPA